MEDQNIEFNEHISSTDSRTSDPEYPSSESSELKHTFGSSKPCTSSKNMNLPKRSRGKRASKSARDRKHVSKLHHLFLPAPIERPDFNFDKGECFIQLDGKIPPEAIRNMRDDYDLLKATIITKPKNINCIQFGMYEIDTWYYSPFPYEYGDEQERLFICEFCLKYMKLEKTYTYHLGTCPCCGPPGKEVYRKGPLTIHEVDAILNRLYCQNLCLLTKLFINYKTVIYDVDRFLFYVLCEEIDNKSHIRGHFSKEKGSPNGQNLNCLLIIPPFQGLGYGKMLIDFSYQLSKKEGVPGSPARPLSQLGIISYESYWNWVILNLLRNFRGPIAITTMIKKTGIAETDIIRTLKSLNLFTYWAGPNTICTTPTFIQALVVSGRYRGPQFPIDPQIIRWTPSWLSRESRFCIPDSSSEHSSPEHSSSGLSSVESLMLPTQVFKRLRYSP